MNAFLQQVMAERRRDARLAARRAPRAVFEADPLWPHPRRSLRQRLAGAPGGRPAVIAELKRASPSAGLLRADYAPADLARLYERAGAAAISVLTEPRHFLGRDADLQAVRRAVSLPILRKDFLSTPYQLAESRRLGADAVLLIAAGLTGPQLALLYREALVLGLEALIEVHTRAELERVRRLDRAILGVNSRNLSTLKTDLAIARSLAPCLPAGRPAVAESGLRTAADIRGLQALGYRGFLIGGTLMKAADPGQALARLLGACSPATGFRNG